MIIDRLSILALKEYHMREQAQRSDAPEAHRLKCSHRLGVIRTQRTDLTAILLQFWQEIRSGRRGFKVYYQMKMYNDPTLNPQLYQRARS